MKETENAIEVHQLSASYGAVKVLSEVEVAFPSAKFSVLLGANGSGKSTLFKILSGLLKAETGTITFFGKEKSEMLKRYQKNEGTSLLGFLTQSFSSIFPFTAKEIMLTGRASYSRFSSSAKDWEKVQQVAQQLEIEHLLERPFHHLSGGQQQMVLIGRILVQNPRIILLDEPTNHLDLPHQHHLLHRLKTLKEQGYTVIAIMHDPVLAHQYADEVFYLKDQKILGSTLSTAPNLDFLQQVYEMDFELIETREGKRLFVVPLTSVQKA